MIDQGRLITEAVSVPVIGDADNGYGNCVNVKRTVKGFINAGFAGIILEDQDALVAIKGGHIPPPGSLPSFEEIKDTLGFNLYYEEEKRYVVTPAQSSYRSGYYDYTSEASSPGDTKSRTEKSQEPVIDILPQPYDLGSTGGRGPSTRMWARTLRLKITGRDGVQKN